MTAPLLDSLLCSAVPSQQQLRDSVVMSLRRLELKGLVGRWLVKALLFFCL